MNKKNKVIVLGSLAFDYIMAFDENFINAVSIDPENEKYQSTVTAKSRSQRFGGTAGNIAYNLGLLNIAHVSLFGSVGSDFENLGYKAHIDKFKNIELGVDIHPDLFTAACYIVNDIKANQMIVFHGGAMDRSRDINLIEKIKDPENYLYAINSTLSVETMTSFAEQLFKMKIPMIFDPGQVTPLFPKGSLLDILNQTEILIGNSYEISQIMLKTELSEEKLLDLVKAIIITKGEQGSELMYRDQNRQIFKIEIPIAKPKNIQDTTGAGDGYRAGILSGLILNLTLLDACRLGSIVSSFVIETSGAQTQNYTIQDVRKRFFDTYGYVPSGLESL
ncbi:MAG: carbohydrate kinase family protein [Candidatus Lokiarchaeota archaeon]|jgi:adenosine kinase